jgi:hypothetical protein
MTAWVAMKASSSFLALMEDMTAIAALRVASSKTSKGLGRSPEINLPVIASTN